MIRCNLSILLAEQNLKITKVSKDTGISRTTLTSLCNNYSQGIQFDTLNTLCLYLKVCPEQLISYVPIDIHIEYVRIDGELLDILISITRNSKIIKCSLCGDIYSYSNFDGQVDKIDISVGLWETNDDVDVEKENQIIINAFHQLPRSFLTDLQNDIVKDILSDFPNISETYDLSFLWCDDLL